MLVNGIGFIIKYTKTKHFTSTKILINLDFYQLTILSPVASPRRPPKVMMGVKHAKYKKNVEATDCNAKASVKSLRYQGSFLFTSLIRPPNNLKEKKKKTYVHILKKNILF